MRVCLHSYNDTVNANAEVIIEHYFRRFLSFEALFKKFCKRDFCDEVRDFKIPEPEAVAS